MTRANKFAWLPIPKISLLAIFVLMFIGSFAASFTYLHAEYFLWSLTNRIVHDTLWISGSVLSGASAVLAIMISPRNSIFTAQFPVRSRSAIMLYQLGAIVFTALVGHLFGLMPLIYLTAMNANGGIIAWQSLLVVVSGIASLSSIGFFTGLLIKRIFIAPLIAIINFLLMGIISEPFFRPLALIFPVHQVSGSARFETNPAVAIFSFIFALATILAWISVLQPNNKCSASSLPDKKVLASQIARFIPAVSAFLLIGCAFVWRPELLTVRYPVKVKCFEQSEISICLHEQNVPAQQEVEKVIKNLQMLGFNNLVNKISDDAAANYDLPADNEVFISLDPGIYGEYDVAANIEESIVWQIISAATTGRPCSKDSVEIVEYERNAKIAAELFTRSGYAKLAEHINSVELPELTELSNEDFRIFLEKNKQDIAKCSLAGAQN